MVTDLFILFPIQQLHQFLSLWGWDGVIQWLNGLVWVPLYDALGWRERWRIPDVLGDPWGRWGSGKPV